jgi:hypothetical protein
MNTNLESFYISFAYTWFAALNFLAAWRIYQLRKTAVISYKKMFTSYIFFHLCLAIPLLHATAVMSFGYYDYQWIFAIFMTIGSLIAIWGLF